MAGGSFESLCLKTMPPAALYWHLGTNQHEQCNDSSYVHAPNYSHTPVPYLITGINTGYKCSHLFEFEIENGVHDGIKKYAMK